MEQIAEEGDGFPLAGNHQAESMLHITAKPCLEIVWLTMAEHLLPEGFSSEKVDIREGSWLRPWPAATGKMREWGQQTRSFPLLQIEAFVSLEQYVSVQNRSQPPYNRPV